MLQGKQLGCKGKRCLTPHRVVLSCSCWISDMTLGLALKDDLITLHQLPNLYERRIPKLDENFQELLHVRGNYIYKVEAGLQVASCWLVVLLQHCVFCPGLGEVTNIETLKKTEVTAARWILISKQVY